VYHKYINGVRGNSCPMYPSCSKYSIESFKKLGLLQGLVFTPDRLLRCGHENHFYANAFTPSGLKKYDPIGSSEDYLVYRKPFLNYAYVDTTKHRSSLKLIKKLINNSFFSEALLEINRFLVSNKDNNDREIFVNYLVCLDALGKQEKAIFEYEVNFPEKIKNDEEILIQIARIWKHLENRKKEIEYLIMADSILKINNISSNTIQLGIASAHVNLGEWDNAKKTLDRFDSLDVYYYKMAENRKNLILKYGQEKFKKPALGAIFNIIPGMGYLYAQHKSTAISAFVLNSLLIYATYSNFENNNIGMASLTGVFSIAFYISGIIGAKKSVYRYNMNKTNQYKNSIYFNY